MRVLVTGGAGFVGSHIVDMLIAHGHDVCVLDNFSSGHMLNLNDVGVNIFERDVRDAVAVMDITDRFQPDAICHQAAQPSLRKSIDDPAHDASVNIIGTLNVIQAATTCGAHVVFASTSAVYDPAGGTFTEDSPIMPNLPYGIAKATAETYLRNSGVPHTILRYGNVYGPRQVQVGENQLVPHCLAHILDGRPFRINGDGKQTRDFVYVEDIARANVLAIEGKVQGTFNCGRGQPITVRTMCEALATLCTPWQGEFAYGPAKGGEARHVSLDSSKSGEHLGWWAEANLMGSLKRTIAWWKEQQCASV